MLITLKRIPKFVWVWLISVASLVFFIGVNGTHISSDGVGYYDYLPATFIYKDLSRGIKWYDQIQRIDTLQGYIKVGAGRVIKYPVGVSVLLSPFFGGAYLIEKFSGKKNITGYEKTFHNGVWVGAVVYFLITLMLFQKTLKLLNLSNATQWYALAGLGLASNVMQYINGEAAFSHVYAQFLISLLVYLFVNLKPQFKNYAYIVLVLGFIYLTRPVDLISLASVPFLISLNSKGLEVLKPIIQKRSWQFFLLFIFSAFVFFQAFLWFLQANKWWVDTYANEHFNSPLIGKFLFSYKKGWLLYSPFLILSFVAIPTLAFKKDYSTALGAFVFLFAVVYILSSWEVWWYNCGYGQRGMIDFYPILFVLIALMFNNSAFRLKIILWIFLGVCVLLNQIQARQYRTHIINWEGMDKIKYWNVFLSNSNRFIGFAYKKEYDFNRYNLISSHAIKDQIILKNDSVLLLKIKVPEKLADNHLAIFKISSFNTFNRANRAKLYVTFKRNGRQLYSQTILFSNLTNTFMGRPNYGYYVFELNGKKAATDEIILNLKTEATSVKLQKTFASFWLLK